jgi:cytochrome b561
MEETIETLARPTRADAGRFDRVTIALHWATVAMVVGQFTLIWLLEQAGDDGAAAGQLLTAHRSEGVALWWLVVLRLAWRLRFAHLPPFPASMPKSQQLAAKANEYGLYALLALQPLTGLGDTIWRGKPFMLFLWRVPKLAPVDTPLFHLMHGLHEAGALALLGLVSLHAAAALLHGLVLRDGVLQRMLPWTARDAG